MISLLITIILIVITVLGSYYGDRTNNVTKGVLLTVTGILVAPLLLINHGIYLYRKPLVYQDMVESRVKTVQYIVDSDKLGLPHFKHESEQERRKFNKRLAILKRQNKNWFWGQYVDGRVETLHEIGGG